MTRLSVNLNKIATLRNARGGNNPDLIRVAKDVEKFGAQGITVHPRPDERHIRFSDVLLLKDAIETEFNIEGYPDQRYLDIIEKARPAQATLVPDPPEAITSNAGWQIANNADMLADVISKIKKMGARVSLFIDPDPTLPKLAKDLGADRVELYTEPYASGFVVDRNKAVSSYVTTAKAALEAGLEINAGHDLDLENLRFLKEKIPFLTEVSIGHALICDALYLGLENTIQMYLRQLRDE